MQGNEGLDGALAATPSELLSEPQGPQSARRSIPRPSPPRRGVEVERLRAALHVAWFGRRSHGHV